MMSREDREKLNAACCRHYKGSHLSDTCKAGVCFLNWNAGSRLGFIPTLPCYGGLNPLDLEPNGSVCEKYSPYTREEIDAREAEVNEILSQCRDARKLIVAAIGESHIRHGVIQCPRCEGSLHYSQASNGHVHAQCQTRGCLSWME